MTTPLPKHPEVLTELGTRLWDELALASHTRGHGWRTPALATVGLDGAPDARTVVLREVDAGQQTLVLYTDARSPKVAQLAGEPRASLLLWCAQLGWQLRLRVSITVETAGLGVSSRWARLMMTPSAQDYLSPLPPGSPLDHPLPQRDSREHFAVLTAQVHSMDWLHLDRAGHQRARFTAGETPVWLQP
jgi:pyridoxamine 5'-phosphate oxidase